MTLSKRTIPQQKAFKSYTLYAGFIQSLEFLKNSGNLQTTFPDLEKVWKRQSLEKWMKSGIFLKEQQVFKT